MAGPTVRVCAVRSPVKTISKEPFGLVRVAAGTFVQRQSLSPLEESRIRFDILSQRSVFRS